MLKALAQSAAYNPFTMTCQVSEDCKLAILHKATTALGLEFLNRNEAGHLVISSVDATTKGPFSDTDKDENNLKGWSIMSINGRKLKDLDQNQAKQIISYELNRTEHVCIIRFTSPEKIQKDINTRSKSKGGVGTTDGVGGSIGMTPGGKKGLPFTTPSPLGAGGSKLLMTPVSRTSSMPDMKSSDTNASIQNDMATQQMHRTQSTVITGTPSTVNASVTNTLNNSNSPFTNETGK